MNKARSKYIVVLAFLTLVILGSQMLMQTAIRDSKSDARIINISGRQRMLSQKITKSSLMMLEADSQEQFAKAKQEMIDALNLWSQSHDDLKYGSDEIDVSEMNESKDLLMLYATIEPLFNIIREAGEKLTYSNYEDILSDTSVEKVRSLVIQITSNEAEFLKLMNKITFQYDKLASAKIEWLSRIEYFLMAFTLVLIILEALLIFRPMFKDTKQKAEALSQINGLREDEKLYAANQIKEANHRIRSLREIALRLKKDLEESKKEFAEKLSDQMADYARLSNEYEKLNHRRSKTYPNGEGELTQVHKEV